MILGVSHTVLIVFCNIIHIGSIYLEPHVICVNHNIHYAAHNGVHLISVKLCQLLLLFKLCLQSDCNLHTVNQLCMLHIPDKTQYVWDTTYLWTPSYAHKKCIVMCLCTCSKSIEHHLWSVL